MGTKPKAGGAKKRPAKAATKTAKAINQRERFIEAARAAGVDESGKAFERAVYQLLPARRPRS